MNGGIAQTTAHLRSLFLFTQYGLTTTWLLIKQLPVKRPSNLDYSYIYPKSCDVESKEPRVWNVRGHARSRKEGGRRVNHGRQQTIKMVIYSHHAMCCLQSHISTLSQGMAERTEILSMFETDYKAQSGHEADDACWLEEVLRCGAAFEEERLRVLCAASNPDLFDSRSPTPCLRCGVSFHTEGQFRYSMGRTSNFGF